MSEHPIPLDAGQAIGRYFLHMRCKVVEIAASIDRIQRCRGGEDGMNDYRIAALRRAMRELLSDAPGRVERIQLILSDPTTEPIPSTDEQSARGAYRLE